MKSFDQKTYRECCAPKTVEQADQDLEAFVEAVYELRKQYRIPDVYVIAQVAVETDGEEALVNSVAHFGDQFKREGLAAFALGYESRARQETIAKIAATAGRGIKQHGQKELF